MEREKGSQGLVLGSISNLLCTERHLSKDSMEGTKEGDWSDDELTDI